MSTKEECWEILDCKQRGHLMNTKKYLDKVFKFAIENNNGQLFYECLIEFNAECWDIDNTHLTNDDDFPKKSDNNIDAENDEDDEDEDDEDDDEDDDAIPDYKFSHDKGDVALPDISSYNPQYNEVEYEEKIPYSISDAISSSTIYPVIKLLLAAYKITEIDDPIDVDVAYFLDKFSQIKFAEEILNEEKFQKSVNKMFSKHNTAKYFRQFLMNNNVSLDFVNKLVAYRSDEDDIDECRMRVDYYSCRVYLLELFERKQQS